MTSNMMKCFIIALLLTVTTYTKTAAFIRPYEDIPSPALLPEGRTGGAESQSIKKLPTGGRSFANIEK
ncbi:unnamed protein product [Ixodes pacificus]